MHLLQSPDALHVLWNLLTLEVLPATCGDVTVIEEQLEFFGQDGSNSTLAVATELAVAGLLIEADERVGLPFPAKLDDPDEPIQCRITAFAYPFNDEGSQLWVDVVPIEPLEGSLGGCGVACLPIA